ncbi:hypothetical protein ACGFZS_47180 [Streptomyces sp. NPDC048288]|uniref:hypothetical protein n=1 Tax=Streptomyces sp. NPDC048288 TaxID=3365529 RepID=UPI00371AE770
MIPDPQVLGTDFNTEEPLLLNEWAIRYEPRLPAQSYITVFGTDQDRAFAAMDAPLADGERRTLLCRDVRYTPWGVEGARS